MIIHVDMDAFYASVEIRDRPELAGRPVVVGGSAAHRGVVAAASYTARRYGIRSAMPMATAQKLCPRLVRLPVDMPKYLEVSEQIRRIFYRYTPDVEPLALDEAFLDVTHSERLFGQARRIADRIRQTIRTRLGLSASVGIAGNKFVAKTATELGKPDGCLYVPPGEEQSFLDPLPVSRIWGLGRRAVARCRVLGIVTIKDLRSRPRDYLAAEFGAQGVKAWELAQGIDRRPVRPERDSKSVSHELTFAEDIASTQVLLTVVHGLAEQVAWRLRSKGLKGRGLTVKLRNAMFQTVTRSCSFATATDSTTQIRQAARALLLAAREADPTPLRLLGLGMSKLDRGGPLQQSLALEPQAEERNRRIDRLTDLVNARFGKGALRRGPRR